jgi:hypothetical protein
MPTYTEKLTYYNGLMWRTVTSATGYERHGRCAGTPKRPITTV